MVLHSKMIMKKKVRFGLRLNFSPRFVDIKTNLEFYNRGRTNELLQYWALLGSDRAVMATDYLAAAKQMEDSEYSISYLNFIILKCMNSY